MLLKAAKCQGVIVFTVSELLRENQQDGGGGGVKLELRLKHTWLFK